MGLHGGEEQLGAMGEKPQGCGKVTWTKSTETGQGTLPGCSSVPEGQMSLWDTCPRGLQQHGSITSLPMLYGLASLWREAA